MQDVIIEEKEQDAAANEREEMDEARKLAALDVAIELRKKKLRIIELRRIELRSLEQQIVLCKVHSVLYSSRPCDSPIKIMLSLGGPETPEGPEAPLKRLLQQAK